MRLWVENLIWFAPRLNWYSSFPFEPRLTGVYVVAYSLFDDITSKIIILTFATFYPTNLVISRWLDLMQEGKVFHFSDRPDITQLEHISAMIDSKIISPYLMEEEIQTEDKGGAY